MNIPEIEIYQTDGLTILPYDVSVDAYKAIFQPAPVGNTSLLFFKVYCQSFAPEQISLTISIIDANNYHFGAIDPAVLAHFNTLIKDNYTLFCSFQSPTTGVFIPFVLMNDVPLTVASIISRIRFSAVNSISPNEMFQTGIVIEGNN